MTTKEQQIENIVQAVLAQMGGAPAAAAAPTVAAPTSVVSGGVLDFPQGGLLVPAPADKGGYDAMMKSTSARIGVWRAGSRPLTQTMLKFRADHAVAQDAVLSHADEAQLDAMGFLQLCSKVADKDEFLTRPDLGRILSDESIAKMKQDAPAGVQIQFVAGDGLSAKAIDTNLKDVFTVCKQGLAAKGYKLGRDIFVKNARVGVVNCIGEILKPELIVLFIGERPGLGTAESMSCYLTYKPSQETVEAQRTMISNIHKGGIPPVEAGAQVVTLIEKIMQQKCSGLDLKL